VKKHDIPIVAVDDLVAALEGLPGFTLADRGDDENEDRLRGARSRPYSGQPWTYHGERGQLIVTGLTMRDVGDCVATAFNRVCAHNPGAPVGSLDTEALGQNVLILLEHLQGIFPNIRGGR
jgi:hypothetical protein